MLCAVYGVMIFANTLTGLWVESLFPYLFAFPILICAIKQTPQVSLCALVAMFILTLMLGSLTTWLIAGSMLAAGWVFGWGIHRPGLDSGFLFWSDDAFKLSGSECACSSIWI